LRCCLVAVCIARWIPSSLAAKSSCDKRLCAMWATLISRPCPDWWRAHPYGEGAVQVTLDRQSILWQLELRRYRYRDRLVGAISREYIPRYSVLYIQINAVSGCQCCWIKGKSTRRVQVIETLGWILATDDLGTQCDLSVQYCT